MIAKICLIILRFNIILISDAKKKDKILNFRIYHPIERENNTLLHTGRMEFILNNRIIFDETFLNGKVDKINKYDKYMRRLLNL